MTVNLQPPSLALQPETRINTRPLRTSACPRFSDFTHKIFSVASYLLSDLKDAPWVIGTGIQLMRENIVEWGGGLLGSSLGREIGIRSNALSRPLGRLIGCGATPFIVYAMTKRAIPHLIRPGISVSEVAKKTALCGIAVISTIFVVPMIAEKTGEFLGPTIIPEIADISGMVLTQFWAIRYFGSQEELVPTQGSWKDSYPIKSLQSMAISYIYDVTYSSQTPPFLHFLYWYGVGSLSYNARDLSKLYKSVQEGRALTHVLPGRLPGRLAQFITMKTQFLQVIPSLTNNLSNQVATSADAIIIGTTNYFKVAQHNSTVRQLEAEIYEDHRQLSKELVPMNQEEIQDRIMAKQNEIRQLNLLQDPFALILPPIFNHYIVENLSQQALDWFDSIDHKLFGQNIRSEAGDKAFKAILGAHAPALCTCIWKEFEKRNKQVTASPTELQQKMFYEIFTKQISQHYIQSTPLIGKLTFKLMTPLLTSQIPHSPLAD